MKIYLESTVECTVDGVGLLEPGKPVEVDPEKFRVFHNVSPAEANFPRTVQVIFDTERPEAEEAQVEKTEEAEVEKTEEEVQ